MLQGGPATTKPRWVPSQLLECARLFPSSGPLPILQTLPQTSPSPGPPFPPASPEAGALSSSSLSSNCCDNFSYLPVRLISACKESLEYELQEGTFPGCHVRHCIPSAQGSSWRVALLRKRGTTLLIPRPLSSRALRSLSRSKDGQHEHQDPRSRHRNGSTEVTKPPGRGPRVPLPLQVKD